MAQQIVVLNVIANDVSLVFSNLAYHIYNFTANPSIKVPWIHEIGCIWVLIDHG